MYINVRVPFLQSVGYGGQRVVLECDSTSVPRSSQTPTPREIINMQLRIINITSYAIGCSTLRSVTGSKELSEPQIISQYK